MNTAHVSIDVVFDEAGQWDWGGGGVDTDYVNEGSSNPFRVEYMLLSTGRAPEELAAKHGPEPLEHFP
jgi:hypothetical protein